jgi:hypothetical protein
MSKQRAAITIKKLINFLFFLDERKLQARSLAHVCRIASRKWLPVIAAMPIRGWMQQLASTEVQAVFSCAMGRCSTKVCALPQHTFSCRERQFDAC